MCRSNTWRRAVHNCYTGQRSDHSVLKRAVKIANRYPDWKRKHPEGSLATLQFDCRERNLRNLAVLLQAKKCYAHQKCFV